VLGLALHMEFGKVRAEEFKRFIESLRKASPLE
jgi:hypothetical protein